MTETIVHVDGDKPLAVLDEHGWTQGSWEDSDTGAVCLHGAIRLCQPQPGDAYLIEQVAARQGWGTTWNDAASTTETDVRARLARGIDITDADLEDTFGPMWRPYVSLIRRAAVLTPDEARLFDATLAAARAAARAAAWAVVTWDLATEDGPYSIAHRDLLIAPWAEVCGLPEGLRT